MDSRTFLLWGTRANCCTVIQYASKCMAPWPECEGQFHVTSTLQQNPGKDPSFISSNRKSDQGEQNYSNLSHRKRFSGLVSHLWHISSLNEEFCFFQHHATIVLFRLNSDAIHLRSLFVRQLCLSRKAVESQNNTAFWFTLSTVSSCLTPFTYIHS